MPDVWLNGDFRDDSAATVSARDAGFLHGAGVFTTMRAYGGRVFRLGDHLRRLRESCEALFVPLTYKDAVLEAAASELLSRNGLADARLRLTVTRGTKTHDELYGPKLEPTCLLTAAELLPYPAEWYERGMTAMLLDEQKLNPYDVQAGHKTLDYLSRFAALKEATRRGAGEALWFSVHNYLQSASVANVFLVEGSGEGGGGSPRLVTPPTNADLADPALRGRCPYPRSNALPGVTRRAVLALAAESGVACETSAVDVNRLLAADEVFLTNSVMGVMPVARLEQKPVGDGTPGPLTRRLMRLYDGATRG